MHEIILHPRGELNEDLLACLEQKFIMSSVDPESSEEGQEKAVRAEELKNTANQFFKGSYSWHTKVLPSFNSCTVLPV